MRASNKHLKVLHFTPHNENCGVGKYQEQFLEAMAGSEAIDNKVFDASPYQTRWMSKKDLSVVLDRLASQLKDRDILHIQHELGLFRGSELLGMVQLAHRLNKKVVMTVHAAPGVAFEEPHLSGLGPHSFMHYARQLRAARRIDNVHLRAMRLSDLVLVHNEATKQNLIKYNIEATRITKITHPVPMVVSSKKSDEIGKRLDRRKGDVVLSLIGFITPYKGALSAVKALNYLPAHYKLAIIGGPHPFAGEEAVYDKVCDQITKDHLSDRVYITGYVDEDDRLEALIDECDVCLYPYDKRYYSYVSSGALSHGFANHKPILAYPTTAFAEINEDGDVIALTKSFNYYELARSASLLDLDKYAKLSASYANAHSYAIEADKLISIYREMFN